MAPISRVLRADDRRRAATREARPLEIVALYVDSFELRADWSSNDRQTVTTW